MRRAVTVSALFRSRLQLRNDRVQRSLGRELKCSPYCHRQAASYPLSRSMRKLPQGRR